MNNHKEAREKEKIDQQIKKAAQRAEQTRRKNLPVKIDNFLHFR
ncbi:MAG: hypothetical protein ACI32O_08260 [Enterococcus sp.]